MTIPEPSDDRTEWDLDATLSESGEGQGLLAGLTPDELADVREAVAGIGGVATRDSSSCPTRLDALGPYRDLEEIGRGGMGRVYRAIEPATGVPVAVKIPSPGLAGVPDARRRFILEAEVVRRLNHPGVVPHIKSGEDRGRWYIVSEFCDGPNLEAWLKHRKAPVPPREVARLIRTLADAVEHAHGRNVLHRDVKPSNILLPGAGPTSDAESLSPRLTDFGLAKLIDAGLETLAGQNQAATGTGIPIGSPPYMAPELASGGKSKIDRRTDVYGLGAVLYEMLTGRPPFRGENTAETLRMVLHDEPIPVRVLRPGAPKSLETIALKCLEKDPDRRYRTAGDLRDDLDRYLAGRRPLARPLGAIERVRRWSRRRPRLALGLAASLALVLLFIGGVAASNLWLRRLVEELEQSKDDLNRSGKLLQASNEMFQATNAELLQERDRADRNTEAAQAHYYASQIQVASEALKAGQLSRVQTILRDLAPEPGGVDRREFAWHYLWRTARREVRQLPGLTGGLAFGALSPDERHLAWWPGGSRYRFGMYDLSGERPLWEEACPPGTAVYAQAFSPDGSRAAFVFGGMADDPATRDTLSIEIRDVGSGSPLGRIAMPQARYVRSVGFLDAGRTIAAVLCDAVEGIPRQGWLLRWELRDGALVTEPVSVRPFAWLATTRDGLRYAGTAPDGRLGIYDLAADRWIGSLPDAPTVSLQHVAFSDDGRRLAVARSAPLDLAIFDVATGRRLETYTSPSSPLVRVAFQPGGEGIVVLGEDQEVRILDRSRGLDVVVHGATEAPGVWTKHLMYSPDGASILVHRSEYMGADHHELRSSEDGRLLGEPPVQLAKVHDGAWVVRGGDEPCLIYGLGRLIWRWDWERTLTPEVVVERAHRDEVWGVAYTADGSIRATAANNDHDLDSIRLWDARAGREIRAWKGHDATVSDLAFSPDGKTLITVSMALKDPIRLWEVPSGREIAALDLPGEEAARSLAIDPGGRRFYVGGDRGTVSAWDVARRRCVWTALTSEAGMWMGKGKLRIYGLAVSPDGRRLASVDDANRVRVFDAEAGGRIAEYTSQASIYAVAYSPDGRTLAVGDREGRILFFEAESLRLMRNIPGDDIELWSLAYSPDGKTLAAGGLGGVVRFWDARTGDELMSLTGHEAQINALTFSPDGATLVSADHSGVLRFWRTRDDAPR